MTSLRMPLPPPLAMTVPAIDRPCFPPIELLQESAMNSLKPFVLNLSDLDFLLDQVNFVPLFDAGGKIGTELTGGQRANLDYVLENLADPGTGCKLA